MQDNTNTKQPTHIAYQVEEGRNDDDKSYWTRIGAAWSHGDSKGFSIRLNAMPLDGEITLRVPSEKKS